MLVKQTVLQKVAPKKLSYNIKFDSKWCIKYPLKASSSQTNFLCVVCSWEFSCVHQGEADVKRHILTKTHKDKASSL
jgi:hypothetical protein